VILDAGRRRLDARGERTVPPPVLARVPAATVDEHQPDARRRPANAAEVTGEGFPRRGRSCAT
jgi:hypothetical protein